MSATLKHLQSAVQNYLLDPQQEPADLIAESKSIPAEIRLGIYANAYRARMIEAMAADYQALQIYLGDDAFETLIGAYIEANPSRYFSMRWVGGKLGEFIKTTEPYNQHIDLYELALFEWVLCHAFDAAGALPQYAEQFSALAPEQWTDVTLKFSPSLQIIALQTNAPQLWTALNAGEIPPTVTHTDIKQMWLVWRQQLKLMFRPAAMLEAIAIEQFQQGNAFGAVCALLANHLPEDEVPARAVGLLQQWLQDELIVAS